MRKTRARARPETENGFAGRLKQLRIERNLSQADLARKTGLSGIHISRYERGISNPTADNLRALAQALDVSGDYLFHGAEEGAARVRIEDRKVLELFKEIQELPAKDRDYVLQVIDDLLTTRRFREMAAR